MSIAVTYRANGKLLLTGEYLILHGTKAIALPLQLGQQLTVSEDTFSGSIIWQAFYDDKIWFECELNPTDFSVIQASHPEKARILSKIFQTIQFLNPTFQPKEGTKFNTFLEANPEWGFGSSSTLISLLAEWAKVNPFALNEIVFGGSGFDIACAKADGPIFFLKNKPVQSILLDYPFEDRLYFVYSGQKKPTRADVSVFMKKGKPSSQVISEGSALSDEFANCSIQAEFDRLIIYHEKLIGNLIGKTPVKQEYFSDFNGEIKSLGAWGGDFYLISSQLLFSEVEKYFKNKGLSTLFRWKDLILKRRNV